MEPKWKPKEKSFILSKFTFVYWYVFRLMRVSELLCISIIWKGSCIVYSFSVKSCGCRSEQQEEPVEDIENIIVEFLRGILGVSVRTIGLTTSFISSGKLCCLLIHLIISFIPRYRCFVPLWNWSRIMGIVSLPGVLVRFW